MNELITLAIWLRCMPENDRFNTRFIMFDNTRFIARESRIDCAEELDGRTVAESESLGGLAQALRLAGEP